MTVPKIINKKTKKSKEKEPTICQEMEIKRGKDHE